MALLKNTKNTRNVCAPDFSLENEYCGPVCGLDEVGRGPLAGPVVAACVYIPQGCYTLPFIPEIKDSKKLSHGKLEELYALITQHCAWAVAEKSPAEIDEMNILQASLEAMKDALSALDKEFAHALVDGNKLPRLPCPATAVVKGDSKSTSIAAASIVAKVTRDRMMKKLHEEHPHYGWDSNVGYPSKAHLEGIDAYGITEHHRKSFAPVKNFLVHGSTRKPLDSAA
ncbi:MAG: ribonuclease HII [Alphaproteobacteria bacterium]